MQKLLTLITQLLNSFSKLLKGGDRWFLVIDEVIVAEDNLLTRNAQLEQSRIEEMRREDFNRRYESQRSVSTDRLTLSEIWATLNPVSLFNFLRYSLSDIFWIDNIASSLRRELISIFVMSFV